VIYLARRKWGGVVSDSSVSKRLLITAADITPEIERSIEDCLDWFEGEPLRTEEFIDRLCDSYGTDFDIESYDNGAARKIMRLARKLRAEA
jgi:hypothetical protein